MNKTNKFKLFLSALTLFTTLGMSTIVSANGLRSDPTIRDMSNRSSYEPGGSRHLFSSRGSVAKRKGKINTIGSQMQIGPLKVENVRIRGQIGYETHFSGHTWQEHSPFDNQGSRAETARYGKINAGGMTAYTLKWSGTEVHPANGYDGEQGGGYPAPKGARDIYHYTISGSATRTMLDTGLLADKNKPNGQIDPKETSNKLSEQEKQKAAINSADIEAMAKAMRWLKAHAEAREENGANGSWSTDDLIAMGNTPFIDVATQNLQDANAAYAKNRADAQGRMDGSKPSYDNLSQVGSALDRINGTVDYAVGSRIDFGIRAVGVGRAGEWLFETVLPTSVQQNIRNVAQGIAQNVDEIAQDNPNFAVIAGSVSRGLGASQAARAVGGAVTSAAREVARAKPNLSKPDKGTNSRLGSGRKNSNDIDGTTQNNPTPKPKPSPDTHKGYVNSVNTNTGSRNNGVNNRNDSNAGSYTASNSSNANLSHTRTNASMPNKPSVGNTPNSNKPDNKTCSFHASTLVKTDKGYTPIADIKIGDKVLAKNEYNGELGYKAVTAQYSNPYVQTVYIHIKDTNNQQQTLIANTIHPFFVNGKWIEAGSLKAGDTLQAENGKQQTVQFVEIKNEALTAYNLTVQDFHTYFVKGRGAEIDAVWVHNECDTVSKPVTRIEGASYKHGESDGGPGQWGYNHTPVTGAAYQHQVTGAEKDTEYIVKTNLMPSGKKAFDGYDPKTDVLLDAKDWDSWPIDESFAIRAVLKDAQQSSKVAKQVGKKLEWHVPTEAKKQQLDELFKDPDYDIDIEVVVTEKG